jgi:hypothetical protein
MIQIRGNTEGEQASAAERSEKFLIRKTSSLVVYSIVIRSNAEHIE